MTEQVALYLLLGLVLLLFLRKTLLARSIRHYSSRELQRRIDELEKFKGREIVCYCQTGSRSLSASIKLRRQGFTTANLRGGMGEWDFQGMR